MVVALTTRFRVALLAVAAALLGGVWLVAPLAAPPLYDGVGFPDEPYRYVAAPPGYRQTPPPTTARTEGVVAAGTNRDQVYVYSAEQGPQVALFFPDKALQVPAGARSVTITAVPLAPSVRAAGASVEGNVYRVSARAPGGTATLTARGQTTSSIQLRALNGKQPVPVVAILHDGAWQRLPTTRVGTDVYQAVLTSFGDYTLLRPDRAAATGKRAGSGGSSGLALGIIAGVVVLLMAGALVAIRVARSKAGSASA